MRITRLLVTLACVLTAYIVHAANPEPIELLPGQEFYSNSTFSWLVAEDGTAVITDIMTSSTSVQIPAKLAEHDVSRIGYFFDGYDGYDFYNVFPEEIKTITVEPGSSYFTAKDGVLFSKDMTVLYRYPCGSNASSYSIPSGVKFIYHKAFNNNKKLISITIPAGVTEIGFQAFEDCKQLATINYTNNASTFPDSLQKIWPGAFEDCKALSAIVIPKNVSSIGEGAFKDCKALTSITVAIGNKFFKAKDDVLFDYDMKTLLYFPAGKTVDTYTVPAGVETIASKAMKKANINSVILPSGLKTIERYAFANCENLTGITIPASVTYIGEGAFEECGLTKDTVKWLGEIPPDAYLAFDYGVVDAPTLDDFDWSYGWVRDKNEEEQYGIILKRYHGTAQKVTIPASLRWEPPVRKIGDDCFSNKEVVSVTIPSTVLEIGACAFYMTRLTSIAIPEGVLRIGQGAFEGCMDLQTASISSSLKSISEDMLSNTGLTSVTISEGVEEIGPYAFEGCEALQSITIPSSVKWIRDCAFSGTGLKTISIPKNVEWIGSAAFDTCLSLTTFSVDSSNPYFKVKDDILYNADFTMLVAYPSGKVGSTFTVPPTVTTVVGGAFEGCKNLVEVHLPDSVEYIGDFAFCDGYFWNSPLTTVTIGNGVTYIGKEAFTSVETVITDNVYVKNWFRDNSPDTVVKGLERNLVVDGVASTKPGGEAVSVTAQDYSGFLFVRWEAEGIELATPSAKRLDFTMPSNDVYLTPIYKFTFHLVRGWNLLATVLELDADSIQALVDWKAFTFNLAARTYVKVIRSGNITPGSILWVFSDKDVDFPVCGGMVHGWEPTIQAGWTPVGSTIDMVLPTSAGTVWKWQDRQYKHDKNGTMEKGCGYWVFK